MSCMQGALSGKIGLALGVANHRSLAWAIARAWHQAGATVHLGYQGDRLRKNVEELLPELGPQALAFACDVSSDQQIERFFSEIRSRVGSFDFLLHSIAYAPREALEGGLLDTTRQAFCLSLDISVYSFIALAKLAVPLLRPGGSLLTLTYYGSQKVVPHYNVMGVAKAALEAAVRYLAFDLGPKGIRVNAISAGPMNTLAARGIAGFTEMLHYAAQKSPLQRNLRPAELGAVGTFLVTDAASAITGQVIYVDCGYSIMGG
jgi:enoyl-[acyl-carrier protein] reductase I